MSDFKMKVTGADKVARNLNKGAKKPIADSLKVLTLKVEALAKKSTVVDTGRLRGSITHEIGKESARVGTDVEYSPFIEYGTYKMEARHMEGGTKVLGEGMFGYTIRAMKDELKEFEVKVAKGVERQMK